MPPCIVGDKCLCPNAPLDGRHYCAICKNHLHGPCGVFNGDDAAVTYRNRCFSCPSSTEAATAKATATDAAAASASGANLNDAGSTEHPNVISSKDVDPKKVSWDDIVGGDRPSTKAGDNGAMVKSIATICGIDAMTFSTEQLRLICSSMKLSGYRSKPKAELLRIIAVGKIHQSLTHFSEDPNDGPEPKTPAKTRNCVFRLINILFSDEMSPKFVRLGVRKDKSILDSGLAGNDEYFWQEVADKFQEMNENYDKLGHVHSLFLGIDPSVKLQHSWSKLRDIYKSLTKSYREVFENHKKSGNHDDFINFCGSKGDVYYLYLWLQEKPQLESMVVADLPNDVFFDSAAAFENTTTPRRSPTESESSFRTSAKSTLAASVNALVEE